MLARRGLLAIGGGYILSNTAALAVAALIVQTGAMPRGHAVHWATLLSFLLWSGLAMWAFTPGNVAKKAAVMVIASMLCAALGYALGFGSPT